MEMDDGPGRAEHDAGYGRELTPLGGSAQGSAMWWLAMDRQDAIDATQTQKPRRSAAARPGTIAGA